MRGKRAVVISAAVLLSAGASACGGERQDANEPKGTWKLEIADASFPAKQTLAAKTTMKIEVRNADTKDAPNVSVTIATRPGDSPGAPQAFASDIADPNVSDASRPIWIVDDPPLGGDTAYTNTWALGPLKAGESRTFEWKVTAVKPGDYTIDYSAAPGLAGKARAVGDPKGSFEVAIDGRPPKASIDDAGNVVREPAD